VRDRPAGETPLRAVRRLLVGLAEERHPIRGFRDRYAGFWRTVLDSPALRARAREALDELEAHLARLIADTSDDPEPRLTAAVAVATTRATRGPPTFGWSPPSTAPTVQRSSSPARSPASCTTPRT
jgi:hypothetical protein